MTSPRTGLDTVPWFLGSRRNSNAAAVLLLPNGAGFRTCRRYSLDDGHADAVRGRLRLIAISRGSLGEAIHPHLANHLRIPSTAAFPDWPCARTVPPVSSEKH